MKFDVSQIVKDYVLTLRGERLTIFSVVDIGIAFGLPMLASIASFWFSSSIDDSFYLSLFTLLGIFIAVFMAIMGVLVPLFHAPRKTSSDPVVDDRYSSEYKTRLKLILEISTAASYLMLFSIASMAILLIALATKSDLFLFKWVSIFVSCHMLVNLLMIMKRIHALFQYEFIES